MEASQLIQWKLEDVHQKALALDDVFGAATQHVRDLLSQAESVTERPTTSEELDDLLFQLEFAYRGERDRMHREILARMKKHQHKDFSQMSEKLYSNRVRINDIGLKLTPTGAKIWFVDEHHIKWYSRPMTVVRAKKQMGYMERSTYICTDHYTQAKGST